MKVAKIMSTRVVTVALDTSLKQVYDIFQHASFHHLLVVDGLKLLGVLSDRDLFKAMGPKAGTPFATDKDNAALNRKVHQIMSRDLITVNQDQTVLHAVRLFNAHRVSCLPVVDNDEQWVGILSWRDIMRKIEHVYGQEPKH